MDSNIIQIKPHLPKRRPPKLLQRGAPDFPLLALTLMLLAFGVVMVLSASFPSAYYDEQSNYDPTFYFKRQMIFAVVGVAAMFFMSRVSLQTVRRFTLPIFILAILMLGAVLATAPVNGARRWISIGFNFQPSEIAKLAIILLYAGMITNAGKRMETFRYGILPFALVLMLIVGLLVLEPHISCSIIIFAVAVVMLFVGGVRLRYLIGGGLFATAGIIVAANTMDYVKNRVEVWRDPFGPQIGDPLYDAAYQIKQSLWAVGSGGFTGLGLGQGRQKYLYLPEEHNDYIFAIVCEELGFIGAMAVLILFALLIIRAFTISMRAPDRYSSLVGVGISTLLAVQVILNVAVVTNFIPCTGISLPFFSYGGTALMMQLAEMGILLSISRSIPARRGE